MLRREREVLFENYRALEDAFQARNWEPVAEVFGHDPYVDPKDEGIGQLLSSAYVEQLLPVSSLGVAGIALHLHSVPKDGAELVVTLSYVESRRGRGRVERSRFKARRELEFLLAAAGLRMWGEDTSAAGVDHGSRDGGPFARLPDRQRALFGAVGTPASRPRSAPAGIPRVYGTARRQANQNAQHDRAQPTCSTASSSTTTAWRRTC